MAALEVTDLAKSFGGLHVIQGIYPMPTPYQG